MRIVLIHRYFWPDTPPYAHILHDIALKLGSAGHDIVVLTCQPSYNRSAVGRAPARERLAPGVEVRRWKVLPDRRFAAAKAVNLGLFCARLLVAGSRCGRVDVVMAASTPPIAVARTASWLARLRSARFVYHKQDIYPEVVLAPGIVRAGRLTALLRRIDAGTDRGAARVVVLSEDMAHTERSRGVKHERIAVINNFDPWALEDPGDRPAVAVAERARRDAEDEPLSVVFAGNLGRFQNLQTVFDAAFELRHDENIAFHFFGGGALLDELRHRVTADALRNVTVHGYQSPQSVAYFLREKADLGIVSLSPGVIRAAYPSKTMSYLRQGCAVLVLVERDSALARTLVDSGAGLSADPSEPGQLAATLRRLADAREETREAGSNARLLYQTDFSRERQLDSWLELFESLASRDGEAAA